MPAKATLPDVLSKAKDAILAIDPDAEVILFGSRARGDHRPDSDWDLLVVTENAKSSKNKHDIRGRLAEFLYENDALLSALFIEKSIWAAGRTPSPVISEVRKDGIKL